MHGVLSAGLFKVPSLSHSTQTLPPPALTTFLSFRVGTVTDQDSGLVSTLCLRKRPASFRFFPSKYCTAVSPTLPHHRFFSLDQAKVQLQHACFFRMSEPQGLPLRTTEPEK